MLGMLPEEFVPLQKNSAISKQTFTDTILHGELGIPVVTVSVYKTVSPQQYITKV